MNIIKKRQTALWVLVVLVILAVGNASAQEENPWESTIESILNYTGNAGGLRTNGDAFGTDLPYANFTSFAPLRRPGVTVASGGLDFGVNLSCSGISADAILANKVGQYEAVLENAVELMPAMVVYYLMYRHPTIAEFADKIEGGFEWALGLANLSCSDVKRLAKQDPFTESQEMGKAKCEADSSGNSLDCFEGAEAQETVVRQRYLDQFTAQFDQWIENMPVRLVTRGTLNFESDTLSDLQNPVDTACYESVTNTSGGFVNYTHAIYALGGLDCNLWDSVGLLLPEYTQNRNENEAKLLVDVGRNPDDNPKLTASALAIEYSQDFIRLINRAVNASPDHGKNFSDSAELNRDIYARAVAEISQRTQALIPSSHMQQLRHHKSKDAKRYMWNVAEMATDFAHIQLTTELYNLRSVVNYGIAMQTDADLPKSVTQGMTFALRAVSAELEEITALRNLNTQMIKHQRFSLGLQ